MPPRSRESALTPFVPQLGRVPDQQIADLAGVSRALVVNFRKKLGIAAYDGYRSAPAGVTADEGGEREFRGRRSALDPFAELLGKVTDGEIARRAGVTAENVRAYRHRRGIPALGEPPRPAPVQAAAPPDPPPSAPPANLPEPPPPAPFAPVDPAASSPAVPTAFLVTVDTSSGARGYAVVARDIAEAARNALQRLETRHPEATIRSIQRIAELLA